MRYALALLVLLLGLAACGGEEEGGDAAGDARPAAELEITVMEKDGGERQATLECDPDGGTHPNPGDACRALSQNVSSLEPIPQDVACTQEYGGPERATIRGTVSGRSIDTELNRTNGCEISRWDHLQTVLNLRDGSD